MALIEKEPIMEFIQEGLNKKHYGHVGVEIITEVEFAQIIDAAPVVRCKNCKWRFTSNCPMFHEEQTYNEDDGYGWVDHDHTSDDGFCDQGESLDEELMDEGM